MKALRSLGSLLALTTLSFLLTNCEQKSSTGPSSGQSVGAIGNITLTADSQELYAVSGATATTQVTATVTDTAGTAMPGILVKFTTPTIGSISSTQDSTNEDGQVSVTYNSQGQYGLANISASVTSGSSTKTGFIAIGVYPLTGVAHDITISLSPDLFYLAPGVDDSCKVTVRVMDSLNVGIPGLHVNLSTTMGIITYADTTVETGTVVTYLHTNEEYGMGIVTASVNTSLPDTGGTDGDSLEGVIIPPGPATWPGLKTGKVLVSGLGLEKGSTPSEPPQLDDVYTISDTDTFWVFPVDEQIGGLSIASYPPTLGVGPDTIGTALISATVIDLDNNGIPGVPISFATNLGTLASSSGTTDSSGTKTVTYYSLANVYGQAKVWAVVGPFSDTTTVNIVPQSANGSLLVYGDNNLIYADNGVTFTNVHALLKDGDLQAIADAPIVFTSDFGTINSQVLTDSNGLANAVFQDIGFASFPDSATIIGKYTPLSLSDSIRVMIAPARGIDHIVLNAATNSMTANGTDSTKVDATVYLENNALAPSGTDVNFTVGGDISGHFSPIIGTVISSGTATVYYFAGSSTGQDSLFAEVDGIYSNPVLVQLNAGPAFSIDVVSEPASLPVNSLEMATVTATVRDSTGNLVGDNLGVIFSTTLGSISPLQAQTVNGEAVSFLSASNTAGPAWVKGVIGAHADSTLVQFIPSEPAFITLTSQYPSITVAGAGGNSQTAMYATVKDAAGNPVGNGVWVHFEILNGGFPYGNVNINNHGYEDSTVTNGGVATAVLNAGVNPGPVQIRAWTVLEDSLGTEISVQQSLVTIVAGPPDYIDINAMSDPNGQQGGDTWLVEVSALVLDALGNEVSPGIAVSFYQLPDTTAQIEGSGYTGNFNWAGDSLNGVAFTTLTYHTDEMFQTITLVAYCMVGADSVIGTQDYLLPLDQNATLDLAVIPEAWNYSYPPPGYSGDPAIMECKSYLRDGHGNAVDNATIIFYSTKGDFFFFQNGTGPSYMKVTGPGGFPGEPYDSTGYATLWLRTWFTQAFPDPTSLNETGTVHSQVMDFFNITSQSITVTYSHN